MFLFILDYFCINHQRFHKCPYPDCLLIYCEDCIAYLGKECVINHKAEAKEEDEESSSESSSSEE